MKLSACLVILFLALLAGCATEPPPEVVTLPEQQISIQELKNIIKQVIPIGIRTISDNGREFASQYYLLEDKQYVAAKDTNIRYWARLLILNSSRPFDIEIEVRREMRYERHGRVIYVDRGYDLRLAGLLKDQLKERLVKRRDDLNLIDDFRVF